MMQSGARHALPFCCILVAIASIGVLRSIASSNNPANHDAVAKQELPYSKNQYRTNDFSRPAIKRTLFHPSAINEMGLNLQEEMGLPKVRRLDDSNLTSSCSLCTRLGAPLLDKFVSGSVNASCEDLEYYYSFIADECFVDPVLESLCCDQSGLLSSYECEKNVRDDILGSYDIGIAPRSGDTRLVNVDTLLIYQYLSNIDVTTSSLELYLTVDLIWKDPRLAWDVTNDTCITSIDMRASHDPETTEIWTPDLDIGNKAKGLQELPDTLATIYSDGTVHWQRGGFVVVMCTFVGLSKMPLDQLGCQLHFWGHQKRVQYTLRDMEIGKGFAFGEYGQSYTEYKVVPKRMNCEYYKDSIGYPSEFQVELFFERSARHYIQFILFPNILFVVLSFGQFFLAVGSGERLAFGVTIVLIMVTQSIVTSSLLPMCQEALWINRMNFGSMVFAMLSLMSTLLGLGIGKVGGMIIHESTTDITRNESDTVLAAALQHYPSADDNSDSTGLDDNAFRDESKDSNKQKQWRWSVGWSAIPKTLTGKVLLVDRMLFISLPIAYLVFLIIMFTTLDNYDDAKDSNGNYVVWVY